MLVVGDATRAAALVPTLGLLNQPPPPEREPLLAGKGRAVNALRSTPLGRLRSLLRSSPNSKAASPSAPGGTGVAAGDPGMPAAGMAVASERARTSANDRGQGAAETESVALMPFLMLRDRTAPARLLASSSGDQVEFPVDPRVDVVLGDGCGHPLDAGAAVVFFQVERELDRGCETVDVERVAEERVVASSRGAGEFAEHESAGAAGGAPGR